MSTYIKTFLTLVAALFFLIGCATNPMGYSDEEWEALSEAEQKEARVLQAEIEIAREHRRAADLRAREAEAARLEIYADQRRESALHGDRIQCLINDAKGYINGRWRSADPVAFEGVRGIASPFHVYATSSSGRTQRSTIGYALFDGVSLSLCQTPDAASCTRVSATTRQFERGMNTAVDVRRLVRGQMRCETPQSYHRGRGRYPQR